MIIFLLPGSQVSIYYPSIYPSLGQSSVFIYLEKMHCVYQTPSLPKPPFNLFASTLFKIF